MNRSEQEIFDEMLYYLCSNLESTIAHLNFTEIELKQKVCAMSSFLEFVKAGAKIEVLPPENNQVTFVLNMK